MIIEELAKLDAYLARYDFAVLVGLLIGMGILVWILRWAKGELKRIERADRWVSRGRIRRLPPLPPRKAPDERARVREEFRELRIQIARLEQRAREK